MFDVFFLIITTIFFYCTYLNRSSFSNILQFDTTNFDCWYYDKCFYSNRRITLTYIKLYLYKQYSPSHIKTIHCASPDLKQWLLFSGSIRDFPKKPTQYRITFWNTYSHSSWYSAQGSLKFKLYCVLFWIFNH